MDGMEASPGLASMPVAPCADERLSTDEAARVARVERRTLLAWVRSGRLPAIRPDQTRRYLIVRADLEKFLSAGSPRKQGRSQEDEERIHRALGI